tara:strand:- start:11673 stop:11936 length:264 start_codon:yes stop_codon:yes gene_type:complete
MSIKKYLVYCEPCGYKRITDGSDDEDLKKVPRSDVPGGAPEIDPITKTVKIKKSTKQPIMVKCPKCGRGIRVRKLDRKNEEEKNKFT